MRNVGLALLIAIILLPVAAGQTALDKTLETQLKRVFPYATAFSTKQARPLPHFIAYTGGAGSQTVAGYAFWTTELEPLERGYDGPIKMLVGLDTNGQINGSSRHRSSRTIWVFFCRASGICPAVQRQGYSRSVQGRRGRGRSSSRIDHHQQFVTRYPKRLPAARPGSADTARNNQVKTSEYCRQFVGTLLLTFAFALAVHAQRADDPWKFADEDEAVPNWTDDLKDQALDLTMFSAFATLALVGFFRKSEPLKWITMGVAVVYLGFARSQLITVVNIFGLTQWNLPVFRHNMTWYLFAIFTLVTTILWGRLYCGRVCAFGSLTQLLDKVVPARLRFEVPRRIDQRAAYIKYGLLAVTVLYFLVTKDISIYRVCRAFLDVLADSVDGNVDRPGRIARGDSFRPKSVLPVPLSRRRVSWTPLQSHCLSDQALV